MCGRQQMSDVKSFKLPDGTSIMDYKSSYDIDTIMDGMNNYFKTADYKFNKERGASLGDRFVSGEDDPQAIIATLKKKHGWVAPIMYRRKPDPKQDAKASFANEIDFENSSPLNIKMKGKPEAQPGPGVANAVAYLLYDPEKREFYRFNPPGLEWGSIPHAARPVTEAIGSIVGEGIANVPFAKGASGLQQLSKLARGIKTGAGMGGRGIGGGIGGAAGLGGFNVLAGALGREDPRTTKEKVGALAGTAAVQGGGGIAAEGALRGASAPIRKLMRGRVPADDLIKAEEEGKRLMGDVAPLPSFILAGDTAKAHLQRRGGFARMIEGLLYKSPFSNTALGNKMFEISDGIDKQIMRILKVDPANVPEKGAVGLEMERTIAGELPEVWTRGTSRSAREGGWMGAFRTRSDLYFEQLKRGLDPLPVEIQPVRDWRKAWENKPTTSAKQNVLAREGLWGSIEDLMNMPYGKATYADVDDLRKFVGEKMESAKNQGMTDKYNLLDGLYKSLKRSQELAPGGQHLPNGKIKNPLMSPSMQARHDLADQWFYNSMELIDNHLAAVMKTTGEYGGKNIDPYKYVERLVKQGDAGRTEAIIDALHSINPEAVEHFTQRYLYNLGRRKDKMGQMADSFELPVFLREYKKAFGDKGTKDVLFKYNSEVRYQLDELVKIASHRLPDYPTKVNPLHTMGMSGIGGVAGVLGSTRQNEQGGTQFDPMRAAMFALGGAVAGAGAQHYTAKLLANAKFVKWLANGLDSGRGSAIQGAQELVAIAAATEDIETKAAIGNYIVNWTSMMSQQYDVHKQRKQQTGPASFMQSPQALVEQITGR